jgi:hypothetical protein
LAEQAARPPLPLDPFEADPKQASPLQAGT